MRARRTTRLRASSRSRRRSALAGTQVEQRRASTRPSHLLRSSDVDVAAHAGLERRAVHELGRRGVLRDVPHRLVDRHLVGRRAPRARPSSTSPSSVPADRVEARELGTAGRRRLERLQRLHEQPRRRGQRRVELAARRREADRRDVRRPAPRRRQDGRRTTTCTGRRRRRPRPCRRRRRAAKRRPGSRATSRTSSNERTSGSIRRCARAWTPEPTTASTRASSRASARTDSADAAAVRSPVIASPSISASARPVDASNRQITAGCGSSPSSTLPGNTPTSFTATGEPARRPAIVSTEPPSACDGLARRRLDRTGRQRHEALGDRLQERIRIEHGLDLGPGQNEHRAQATSGLDPICRWRKRGDALLHVPARAGPDPP